MRGVTETMDGTQHSVTISTHTPHARRDRMVILDEQCGLRFQLTRLMRGVTAKEPNCHFLTYFNSHASCEA